MGCPHKHGAKQIKFVIFLSQPLPLSVSQYLSPSLVVSLSYPISFLCFLPSLFPSVSLHILFSCFYASVCYSFIHLSFLYHLLILPSPPPFFLRLPSLFSTQLCGLPVPWLPWQPVPAGEGRVQALQRVRRPLPSDAVCQTHPRHAVAPPWLLHHGQQVKSKEGEEESERGGGRAGVERCRGDGGWRKESKDGRRGNCRKIAPPKPFH